MALSENIPETNSMKFKIHYIVQSQPKDGDFVVIITVIHAMGIFASQIAQKIKK